MAAAIAASLNGDLDEEATHLGSGSGDTTAETEEMLLLIAQNESKRMEQERVQRERALVAKEIAQKGRRKVYDDIIFDSSAISKIHPRLHLPQVEHMQRIVESLDPKCVLYDAEYFVSRADAAGEIEVAPQTPVKESKEDLLKLDTWIMKTDKFLTDIGL